jgi:hypothetical protein
LIRVHRQQVFTLNAADGDLHLQQLKWPIEYLFLGAKVKDYYAGSSSIPLSQNLDVWDRYQTYSEQTYRTQAQNVEMTTRLCAYDSGATLTLGLAAATADSHTLTGTALLAQVISVGDIIRINGINYRVTTGAAAGAAVTGVVVYAQATAAAAVTASVAIAAAARKITRQGLEIVTKRWAPTLDTLSINAHSIDIYKEFPVGFFNAYAGYHYGGPNINAAEDAGSLFVPFCIYPGTYQPSGHINVSRAREFYVKYACPAAYQFSSSVLGLLVNFRPKLSFNNSASNRDILINLIAKLSNCRKILIASSTLYMRNQCSIVKMMKIGQSAAKFLTL